jgi:hypothetical protein
MNREHKRLVERLESSAQDLISYVRKFSDRELFKTETPGEWSIHQVIAHLRDTEVQVFLFRAKRILSEVNPSVPNFDQDTWQAEHHTESESLKGILDDFRIARGKQVALLRKATDKEWLRTARHPEYGTISLNWLVNHQVNHTLEHLAQIGSKYEGNLLKSLNS